MYPSILSHIVTTTKTGLALHEINLAIKVIKAPEHNTEHIEQLVRLDEEHYKVERETIINSD